MDIQYSGGFKKKVKAEFPKNKKLHENLDSGNPEVGTFLFQQSLKDFKKGKQKRAKTGFVLYLGWVVQRNKAKETKSIY